MLNISNAFDTRPHTLVSELKGSRVAAAAEALPKSHLENLA